MSRGSSIQTLYQTPDLRRHGKRHGSIPAMPAWPSSRSHSSGASAIGSQPSRAITLRIGYPLSPNPRAHLDLSQGRLLRRLCISRAAGTTAGLALGRRRDRGFILQFPKEIAGDDLEQPAFDGVIAPALSAQSLENPHRVLR